MFKIMMVTPEKDNLSDLASALEKEGRIELSWAQSGGQALDLAGKDRFDLLVTDEELGDMTGLELAFKLLMVDVSINCAAVSSLSPDEFHEASEGLGLLAHLPAKPGREHAESLLERLKRLTSLQADDVL